MEPRSISVLWAFLKWNRDCPPHLYLLSPHHLPGLEESLVMGSRPCSAAGLATVTSEPEWEAPVSVLNSRKNTTRRPTSQRGGQRGGRCEDREHLGIHTPGWGAPSRRVTQSQMALERTPAPANWAGGAEGKTGGSLGSISGGEIERTWAKVVTEKKGTRVEAGGPLASILSKPAGSPIKLWLTSPENINCPGCCTRNPDALWGCGFVASPAASPPEQSRLPRAVQGQLISSVTGRHWYQAGPIIQLRSVTPVDHSNLRDPCSTSWALSTVHPPTAQPASFLHSQVLTSGATPLNLLYPRPWPLEPHLQQHHLPSRALEKHRAIRYKCRNCSPQTC